MFRGQTETASDGQRASVRRWQGTDRFYRQVQRAAAQVVDVPDEAHDVMEDLIALAQPLRDEVVVWRGVRSVDETFGVAAKHLVYFVGAARAAAQFFATSADRGIVEGEFTGRQQVRRCSEFKRGEALTPSGVAAGQRRKRWPDGAVVPPNSSGAYPWSRPQRRDADCVCGGERWGKFTDDVPLRDDRCSTTAECPAAHPQAQSREGSATDIQSEAIRRWLMKNDPLPSLESSLRRHGFGGLLKKRRGSAAGRATA